MNILLGCDSQIMNILRVIHTRGIINLVSVVYTGFNIVQTNLIERKTGGRIVGEFQTYDLCFHKQYCGRCLIFKNLRLKGMFHHITRSFLFGLLILATGVSAHCCAKMASEIGLCYRLTAHCTWGMTGALLSQRKSL